MAVVSTEERDRLCELRRRSHYVQTLKNDIFEYVYKERVTAKEERIEELVIENANLLNDTPSSFLYRGKMYTTRYYIANRKSPKTLHPNMIPKVSKVIDQDDFDIFVDENKVKNYISNTLIEAKHTDDLYKLLPSRITDILRWVNREVFDIGPCMTEDAIEKFKEYHREDLLAFGRLFLEQLLTA
jgi:hypothetical protein